MSEKYTTEKVLSVTTWSENLFSFVLTRPPSFKFTAGQFARIGITITDEYGEKQTIFRAYSVVSSPFASELAFFSIVVPNGAFTSRLKHMQIGDDVLVEKIPYGFLTLTRFQKPAPQDLWLLATGTGLAPFLSILQDFDVWQAYQKIVLVYSVRYVKDLAYLELIQSLKADFGEDGADLTFVPIVTREPYVNQLNQRIPLLLKSHQLEDHVGIKLNPNSHIMLCGNPDMVENTKDTLKKMGFTMNRRGEGNIAVENYW